VSTNLGYTKKFIILKKDYLNIKGINPKGHAKIEIRGLKGKLELNIENAEVDEVYFVLLVQKNTEYQLGKLYTDNQGKGREIISFNLQDIESKGITSNRASYLILLRDNNVLMHGLMKNDDGSLMVYIKDIDNRKIVKDQDLKPEQKDEDYVEEVQEIVEVEEVQEEIVLEDDIDDTIEEEYIKSDEEELVNKIETETEIETEEIEIPSYDILVVDDTEEFDIQKMENKVEFESVVEVESEQDSEIIPTDDFTEEIEYYEVPLETEEVFEEELKEVEFIKLDDEEIVEEDDQIVIPLDTPIVIKYEKNSQDMEKERITNQRNQTTNYILNILRFFPFVEPFKNPLKGYSWWKIDFQGETRGFLPYFNYIVGESKYSSTDNYTSASTLMNLYGHYIFGIYNIDDESQYYIYGIPGAFSKEDHPHGGTTGFNTYFEGIEGFGYWLLYIDPSTGKVIHPINPMNPID